MHSGKLSRALMGAAALAMIALAMSAQVDAGLLDQVKRPFKASYEKAKNFKDRRLSQDGVQISENVQSSADTDLPVSGGNDASSGDDQFKAMCVLSRGPSMSKPPSLFFFSPQMNVLGCEVQIELELATLNENTELDQEASRNMIQKRLIDSGIYDASTPTYFIIHGFLASWNSGNWMCDTKDLILNNTEANVFIVDWSGGSKPMLPMDYGASVSNTQYVASLIGEFIQMLMQMTGQQDAKNFRLIGHSLGAHISGFIGYKVGSVGQITGLDPAGPCFRSNTEDESIVAGDNGQLHNNKRRLSPESADFVLALHTDVALFGLDENCGDYDVYVNGGLKQPGCPATSAKSRFNDLVNGKIMESLDINLTCAHSFAHGLLDSFASFTSLAEVRDRLFSFIRSKRDLILRRRLGGRAAKKGAQLDKCYPMAYECANWDAYRAGECGFCRDNDRHCVYTGLSLDNFQAEKLSEGNEYSAVVENVKDAEEDSEDFELNGEDEDEEAGESTKEDQEQQQQLAISEKNSHGQHFMRTASADDPTCLFQYQIIVAAKHSQVDQIGADANKYHYYLNLPLVQTGTLGNDGDDGARHARLVLISHRVDPSSPTYTNLRTTYMDALKERNNDLNDSRDDLDFYTALITFRQAPDDECEPGDQTNGLKDAKDKWRLCDTLDNIQEVSLWSPQAEKLDAVVWVSMNFMSGLEYEQRMSKSYVMLTKPDGTVRSRDEMEEDKRAKLSDLDPDKSKSMRTTVSNVGSRADCMLSVLDMTDKTNTKRNIKCGLDDEELKFALDLEPNKL